MRRIMLLRLRQCPGRIIFQTNEINNKRFFNNHAPKNKLRNIMKLHERGMYENLFPDSSVESVTGLLNDTPQCVYAGFDPTADSLHIGNLLVLMNLLHWQRGGHNVVALVGGATGLIGDPSGRLCERAELDKNTVDHNVKCIEKNIETIFDNHEKYFYNNEAFPLTPVTIVNNIDWYQDVKLVDFVKNIGRHFRMGTMLIKSSVQSRLKSEAGMSFTEFTYQIFQAHDWLHLLKQYNCRFQVGGSDQLGNIVSGHELITRVMKRKVFGLTLPLITSDGGHKFGKSSGNAVWLSPEKSSSFKLYQFFIRTFDTDVEKYLKLFTFLTLPQIASIMEQHKNHPEEHTAQKVLAEQVTLLVHGEEGLKAAQDATLLLYDKSIDALSSMTQEQVTMALEGANIVDMVPNEEDEEPLTVLELALKVKCFKTERDAIRIINAGGFSINYEKVTNVDQIIKPRLHILPNNVTILRTGKKNYHLVRWLELKAPKSLQKIM